MSIDEAMKNLYSKEINCSVRSFWDGQWEVKIGDELNGWRAEAQCVELEDVAQTLIELAKELHPHEDWS
jgi:hypothetical protein